LNLNSDHKFITLNLFALSR